MAKKKKATKAKRGTRKLTATARVDFTELHTTLDKWAAKLDVVYHNTHAPKIPRILEAINRLRAEINCQSTMVIQF